jgi:predicted RNA binding protein YcfA (HicA-like mRNA interferase family)
MGGWRSLLLEMVADTDPRSYTFDDAASVLINLGFFPPRRPSGSHRIFRKEIEDKSSPSGKRAITVGLVDAGKGTLKPIYIREMIKVLRANSLLPEWVE